MVEAVVELEQHPLGGAACCEQRLGARDQIVEIEGGAAYLGVGIADRDGVREADQRHGRLDDGRAPVLGPEREEAALHTPQHRLDLWVLRLQGIGQEFLARGSVGLEEEAGQGLHARASGFGRERGGNLVGEPGVGLAAALEHVAHVH